MTAMTQAEYARARGWSKPYVSKLKRQGKLAFDAAGLVNVEATDALLHVTRDPARGGDRRPGAEKPAGAGADAGGAARAGQTPASTPDGAYSSAAAREKIARARIAELELAELAGQLVRRDQVERVIFDLTRQAMDSLLSMSDRLAGAVAAESDPFRCALLIDGEARQIADAMRAAEMPGAKLAPDQEAA